MKLTTMLNSLRFFGEHPGKQGGRILSAVVLALAVCGFAAPARADDAAMVRKILRENPDIVLDVIREHGDVLLDILQQASERHRSAALQQQWREDAKKVKTFATEGRPARGPEDAPITVVAFTDFTCSFCQKGAVSVETLMNRYPGEIRFILKQVPATETARLASKWFLAALGQDTNNAWLFYALLFDRQHDLINDPGQVLRQLATEANLDPKVLEAQVRAKGKEMDNMLNVDAEDAKRLDFKGTPYYLVNNLVIRGALPLESFLEAVEFAKKS